MSDLSEVNREPLRLKGIPMKKKKKKNKDIKNVNKVDVKLEQHVKNETESKEIDLKNREDYDTGDIQLTKAELACLKKQEKLQMSRILEKASKSHRRLVEEFNSKLDNMSEHYDIPKVSWTK